MNTNSWMQLREQDARTMLPEALRERDPMAARDCGWVEQMTPFIRHHAAPGDWLVDPFCGFGTTLVAAMQAGVSALGVELDAQRAALARERLAHLDADAARYPVLAGSMADASMLAQARGADAARRYTLCLTNVPYFGCPPYPQDAQATGDAQQLYGQHWYADYLSGIRAVFHGVHALLEPGGWCIVMAQNVRVGGRFVPLAWDIARVLAERFTLHEERVLLYDRLAETAHAGATQTNRAHEYALVCRKERCAVSAEAAAALLDRLADLGLPFLLHGSFGRWARGELQADAPADLDVIIPPDADTLSRWIQVLEGEGFHVTSWNTDVSPPVMPAAFAHRYYFRARRLNADGAVLQLDTMTAPDADTYQALVGKASRHTTGGRHGVWVITA